MPNFPLPAYHHAETLTPYSPAVYGHVCAVTGEALRPGDEVIVCDAAPGRDPITVEGWTTLGSCPHCGAGTGLMAAYVPPTWAGSAGWAAPAAPPPQPAAGERSPALVGGLVGLFLLAAAAIAVAVFLFVVRTRGGADSEPTALPIAALTSTSATSTAEADATAVTATATPLVIVVAPSATPTPAAPTPVAPTPTAIPTLAPPTPPPDSPITALVLVNPANERAIRALRADDTVDLSQVGRNTLTVRAEVESSSVESVMFLLDGQPFCAHGNCIENAPPYYMGGDQGGDAYDDWDWSRIVGAHTLTAIACTGDGGAGDCFPPIDVRLTITR